MCGLVAEASWLGLVVGRGNCLVLCCIELSELSQWLCHDDSTVSIVFGITGLLSMLLLFLLLLIHLFQSSVFLQSPSAISVKHFAGCMKYFRSRLSKSWFSYFSFVEMKILVYFVNVLFSQEKQCVAILCCRSPRRVFNIQAAECQPNWISLGR